VESRNRFSRKSQRRRYVVQPRLRVLALEPTQLLFKSPFLLTLGLAYLALVAILCRLYWLRVPFWGMALATSLYAGALIANGA